METIVIAIISSSALAALISGIFNLVISRKGKLTEIEKELKELDARAQTAEKDELRTQLLLLFSDYPTETREILTLAKHYFNDLKGDWYLTTLFCKWLEDNNIANPEWFRKDD